MKHKDINVNFLGLKESWTAPLLRTVNHERTNWSCQTIGKVRRLKILTYRCTWDVKLVVGTEVFNCSKAQGTSGTSVRWGLRRMRLTWTPHTITLAYVQSPDSGRRTAVHYIVYSSPNRARRDLLAPQLNDPSLSLVTDHLAVLSRIKLRIKERDILYIYRDRAKIKWW